VRDKGTNIEMLLIPPGEFVMGKSRGDKHADPDELPAHEVKLTKAFYLGRYEVTQQQWTAINGSNPSAWKKFDRPKVEELRDQRVHKMIEVLIQDGLTSAEAKKTVTEVLVAHGWKQDMAERATALREISEEQAELFAHSWSPPRPADNPRLVEWPVNMVSWEDCRSFCSKTGLRLPTEAEWEFACRAGTRSATYGKLQDVAWHYADYENGEVISSSPCAVGTKAANGFGLFDMLGNVYEWVADNYGPYADAPQLDPIGPPTGEYKVTRGGGDWELSCRASNRVKQNVDRKDAIGLRVARYP
jgi:formylglycine-generating enzyme required for sulfatase activity